MKYVELEGFFFPAQIIQLIQRMISATNETQPMRLKQSRKPNQACSVELRILTSWITNNRLMDRHNEQ
ncbi:hypothetical protein [Vibrio genomosp. F10]|uniref:hypothetical protein n=1 Tax=Vibrio genomosp. F10 TaxID=723171 RepID=UPI00030D7348|nr:hypothetical protein [Vibrio genomosp. F10]OEF04817.1 hypothetical protein A1QI_01925 [Vibrio genomosp. F10 str. 9ZB36]